MRVNVSSFRYFVRVCTHGPSRATLVFLSRAVAANTSWRARSTEYILIIRANDDICYVTSAKTLRRVLCRESGGSSQSSRRMRPMEFRVAYRNTPGCASEREMCVRPL